MSDELERKDELLDEDEELMSDFKDLFDEDDESAGASQEEAAEGGDDELDELDAFLDDFEKNIDIPDAEPQEEGSQAAAEEKREELQLDDEELNLDVEGGSDDLHEEEDELDLDLDVGGAEASDDFEEQPATSTKENESSEMVEEVAAVAATAAAVAPASAATATPVQAAASPVSRNMLIAGIALLTCSTLLSIGALWIGMGLGNSIDVLNENVSDLQQRVLTLSRRGVIAPQAELSDQLNVLGERVNELAVIVEGPVGHMREVNQQALQELDARVSSLEKTAGRADAGAKKPVRAPVAAAEKSSPPATPKPLVRKVTTVAKESAPVAETKSGWVINLLTVASSKTAQEELARLRNLGIRADKQAIQKDGRTLYRLRVTGFDSYEGAKAYIDTVEKQTGFSSAWVARQ